MVLSPEVILTVISTGFIVAISLMLLNEVTEKEKKFKKPKLSVIKAEVKKELKRI